VRLKWFRRLAVPIQLLVLSGLLLVILISYISLSKHLKPGIISLLIPPLKLTEEATSYAKQFFKFQDLAQENKRLQGQIDKMTAQLAGLEDLRLENLRLRNLLSLPERKRFQTQTALVISKDSSNWTKTIMVNKGAKDAVRIAMPVVIGDNLVGRVIETYPSASQVALISDLNSKIPAQILRTREQGIVFGTFAAGRNQCKIKYVQEAEIGDQVISSGLGQLCPKGLLIGEVTEVESGENNLYQVAQIKPAVDLAGLEEVMIITGR
jgi:rod shape-determining protein MreC